MEKPDPNGWDAFTVDPDVDESDDGPGYLAILEEDAVAAPSKPEPSSSPTPSGHS